MFLLQRHCGKILERGRDMVSVLTEDDRKTLIVHAQAYLTQKCTRVEKRHVVLVAKTLVFVVPKLKDNSIGEHAGFVSFPSIHKNVFTKILFSIQKGKHLSVFDQKSLQLHCRKKIRKEQKCGSQ